MNTSKYPNIIAEFGWDWISKWQGRLTDVEMQRQEDHLAELNKHRAHELECRLAAEAVLAERARAR